jgi:hypothetical protein
VNAQNAVMMMVANVANLAPVLIVLANPAQWKKLEKFMEI